MMPYRTNSSYTRRPKTKLCLSGAALVPSSPSKTWNIQLTGVSRSKGRGVSSALPIIRLAATRARRLMGFFIASILLILVNVGGVQLDALIPMVTFLVRLYFRVTKQLRNGVWRRMRRLGRAGRRIVKRIQKSIRQTGISNYHFQELLGSIGRLMLRFTSQSVRIATVEKLLDKPIVVDTPHGPIRFLPHSLSCLGRAKTLMTQEPDSMKWIDRMEPESIFWDVGGNIGNLALYAARRGVLNIWSFEPAAVNYYNLVANCELNAFGDQVTCLQLGFGARTEIARLNVSQLMSGHSFSFRNEERRRQKRARKKMEISAQQAVQLWSIDDFIRHSGAPCPNYLKIDVPGMTQEILQGATHLLSREDVTQIQIKTGSIPEKKKGRLIVQFLEAHGFKLAYRNRKQKKRGDIVSTVQRDLVFVKLEVERPPHD